jgi:hypothetical protein
MDTKPGFAPSELVGIATRTLLAAGYSISGVHRPPDHIEFQCERTARLGATIRFLIAITNEPSFNTVQVESIEHTAVNQNRIAVFVSGDATTGHLSWSDFLDILGGAVPPWRVLTATFEQNLLTASTNKLPEGFSGEPWRLFEDLVADGLEFCLGRRVNRLGAHKRGKKVSDMIAPLPDFSVLVIDAKAANDGFDASWSFLRPLAEYVAKQKERQKGGGEVIAALVVSSKFKQSVDGLDGFAKEFIGETRVPLCFATAETLAHAVSRLRAQPDIRNAIRWKMLFKGGMIQYHEIDREIEEAISERCETRDV